MYRAASFDSGIMGAMEKLERGQCDNKLAHIASSVTRWSHAGTWCMRLGRYDRTAVHLFGCFYDIDGSTKLSDGL